MLIDIRRCRNSQLRALTLRSTFRTCLPSEVQRTGFRGGERINGFVNLGPTAFTRSWTFRQCTERIKLVHGGWSKSRHGAGVI